MRTILFFILLVAVVGAPVETPAAVTLPSVIGSDMVLQRGQRAPIWGWAVPGEIVTVYFAGQKRAGRADDTGRWEVRLSSLKTSATPAEMKIEGNETLILTNILVGEVWFCSGQSNMEKPIGNQPGQKPVFNHEQELASGDNFPLIRIYRVMDHVAKNSPQRNANGKWSVCSSNNLERMRFSAAAYFFGREIQRELNVPVGLIDSSWGGTRIEPWTPPEGFMAVPGMTDYSKIKLPDGKLDATNVMALFNGMVAPIAGFAMRGALWYQGESNCMFTDDGLRYLDKMRALIAGWRKVWGQGNFPFYYVQLAPFRYYSDPKTPRANSPEDLPEIWEAQTLALNIKNTGMIVTTDITDDVKDIHPRNKLDVGKRLSLVALAKTYGHKNVTYSGPMFKKMNVCGDKAILYFDFADGGLWTRDGKSPDWFTIAGADKVFKPANAVIDGRTIVVSSPEVPKPVAVRFAWHELAQPNLMNAAGLPASAFRTDGPLP